MHLLLFLFRSFGENETTHLSRLDSFRNVYENSICLTGFKGGFGDSTDVVAIAVNNPNGSSWPSYETQSYLERLKLISFSNLVSNNHDEIAMFLHDHCTRLKQRNTVYRMLLLVVTHYILVCIKKLRQPPTTPPPKMITDEEPPSDFSVNDNPKYWQRRFGKKANLFKQCHTRGMYVEQMRNLTKRKRATELTSYDNENVHS